MQWVATQWIAAPDGDGDGRVAYAGREQITIDPHFFRRLDERIDAINHHGMLAAPVLLWAALWARPAEANLANPGWALPEEQVWCWRATWSRVGALTTLFLF